jgi:hypothetical protein
MVAAVAEALGSDVVMPPGAAIRASPIQGDWLGSSKSLAEQILDGVAKLYPGHDPRLVPAPIGATVTKPGQSSFIGLEDGYFDAKASYEENLEHLKKVGIPRFPWLSKLEREHETEFARAVQKNPEHYVEGAEILAHETPIPTYEVDAMKRMHEPYGTGAKPENGNERALRLEINHALHPAAAAIAQLAFLKKLDALAKLPDEDS